MSRKGGLVLVVAMLAFAFGLRVWGIGFGLPYIYHPDEPTYVSQALNLGAGIIGRQPNPTGLSNILTSRVIFLQPLLLNKPIALIQASFYFWGG
jgi:hypothetical protein